MSAVADSWAALRGEARGEPGWHLRRIHPHAPCEILVGILQPGATPGILLEVAVSDVPSDLVLPQSKGFKVEPILIGGSASGRVRFALVLSDRAYEPVFAVLCEDTAAAASRGASARAALRDWTGRLHVWQEFMTRHGTSGLSETAVLGLMGELIVLRDYLIPLGGLPAAIGMWVGPAGEPNDFTLPLGFLETKTTSRQAPDLIQITSLAQLDDNRGRILLAHLRLRPDQNGTTLPELVHGLRTIVIDQAGDRLADFDDLLLAVGYVDAQADLYTRPFSFDGIEFYDVKGDFPRLRRADVAPGVRGCSYAIELAACVQFIVPSSTLVAIVGRTLR